MNFKYFIHSIIVSTFVLFAFSCEPNKGNIGTDPEKPEAPTVDPVKGGQPEATVKLEGDMIHMVGDNSPYWWVDGYVSSREEARDRNRGKWYRFYNNGTFEYGMFQENDGVGTWRYDLTNETIYMKSKDGSETMQWKTMMSKTNDKVIFIGPAVGPNKGDQGMLQPYLQKPQVENIAW